MEYASVVLGLISFSFILIIESIPHAIISAILGIILAIIALNRPKNAESKPRINGVALGGLVLSITGAAIILIELIVRLDKLSQTI